MDISGVIGIIGTIIGGFLGLAGWLSGRDKKIIGDAEWRGSVGAKLDNINTGVQGLCGDIKAIQGTLGEHAERLTAVESSAAQAHHRITEIINK
jgi:outer membrane murein-binding lipoprotein Lpp